MRVSLGLGLGLGLGFGLGFGFTLALTLRGGEPEREGARLGDQIDHAEDEAYHLGWGEG